MANARRARGPKPTLRKPERVSLMLDAKQSRAVNFYMSACRVQRSTAIREMLEIADLTINAGPELSLANALALRQRILARAT